MDEKPDLVVFSQNKIGGIQNYFYNLIKFDKKNIFKKRWIFTDQLFDNDAKLPQRYNICDEQIFQYGHENIYKSTKKLGKLITDKPGLVLANHHVELIALHKQRLKNKTIFFFCHDEYYVSLASKYEFLIDVFIAHNIYYFNELKRILPNRRTSDIYYLPYGIEITNYKLNTLNKAASPLKLIFIGRLHKKKGVYDLLDIHKELVKDNINFNLTIIGDGPEKQKLELIAAALNNINFIQPKTTKEVLEIAASHDIYLLPSYLDGIPVALLEAMSVGLVPVIYKFNEGIVEVVKEDNGYIVPSGDIHGVCKIIKQLDSDRNKLNELSKNAIEKISNDYNAQTRFNDYYTLFSQYKALKRPLRYKHIKHDGKLDYPFIPQFVRNGIRRLKSLFK